MNESPLLRYSPLDSNRFSIRVERASLGRHVQVASAISAIQASTAELIIARFPAGDCAIPNALVQRGEALIHADTLVYYDVGLPAPSAKAAANVRLAEVTDLEAIRSIASTAFKNYRAHYAANPLLPAAQVLDGYVEWAQSRADPSDPSSDTWLVFDDGVAAGFATCDIKDRGVEIVLNAVHPSFERRGHYGTLLRHLLHHYAETGLGRLSISTQIWNYTVQRQWSRAGLLLESAYDTFHIDRRIAAQRSTS
ncbi:MULTISPECIES: GNAT family N-acetyltransferase [unclassified Stenotrophomonas]|uniref:GNAT family N-acetyltransferase n=1 Tax=unclassified Stenotrophomonas TaxID=196198 RepID=UPI0012FEE0EE|nr:MULTISPECIES: GNAT family N-acetyltransferase [unclassified Stenotrophomonas]